MASPTTLIFGLGQEVGRAIARGYFDNGHNVLVADLKDGRVSKARSELPEKIVVRQADTTTSRGVNNSLTVAEETFGRVDNLVLIPLLQADDSLQDAGREAFDLALASQMGGCMTAIQEFVKRLPTEIETVEARATQSRQRGTVTFILSSIARTTQPGQFTASVVQGALESLMQVCAIELARENVRVNAVVALRPRAEKREGTWSQKRIPLGRVALADEIASAAIFLSSEGAAIITGESLVIDGGRAHLAGTL